jgi:hypothetical protein
MIAYIIGGMRFHRFISHCKCAWYESKYFIPGLLIFSVFCIFFSFCFIVGVVNGNDILKAVSYSFFFSLVLFSRWLSIRLYVFAMFFACLLFYLCVLSLLAFGFPFCSFTFLSLGDCP